jgi:hypothetical protein
VFTAGLLLFCIGAVLCARPFDVAPLIAARAAGCRSGHAARCGTGAGRLRDPRRIAGIGRPGSSSAWSRPCQH